MFSRVGGKSKLKKIIIKKIPKHKTYVEPFVGGGHIFFGREEPSYIEVINDKDIDIYHFYKDMKKYGSKMINKNWNNPTRKKFNYFLKNRPTNHIERLYRNIYLSLMSYSGNRKSYIGEKTESNYHGVELGKKYKTDKWEKRLKNVKIYNKDFEYIIKKYDAPDTFFYLDPPYEESNVNKSIYYNHSVEPIRIYNALKNIKGNFLLSYNNSPNIRKLFKEFRIIKVKTSYELSGTLKSNITELLIKNY